MRMNKKISVLFALMMAIMIMMSAAGCAALGGGKAEEETPDPGIEDGTYVVTFKSNHAMSM